MSATRKRTKLEMGHTYHISFTNTKTGKTQGATTITIDEVTFPPKWVHGWISSWLASGYHTVTIKEVQS